MTLWNNYSASRSYTGQILPSSKKGNTPSTAESRKPGLGNRGKPVSLGLISRERQAAELLTQLRESENQPWGKHSAKRIINQRSTISSNNQTCVSMTEPVLPSTPAERHGEPRAQKAPRAAGSSPRCILKVMLTSRLIKCWADLGQA